MTAAAKIRLKLIAVDAKMLGTTPVVLAISITGAKYQLRHQFASLAAAERVADRVAAKGSIDEQLWDFVGVQPQSRADAYLQAPAHAEAASRAVNVEARLAA